MAHSHTGHCTRLPFTLFGSLGSVLLSESPLTSDVVFPSQPNFNGQPERDAQLLLLFHTVTHHTTNIINPPYI